MNKSIVEKNFSKSAKHYDLYSDIQTLCASRLIEKLDSSTFEKILDIGCGTGHLTRLLGDRFPLARIRAVDISGEMIGVARNKLSEEKIGFSIVDGELLEITEELDLITSNAAFQWFENLEGALARYAKALNTDGVILFSSFAPRTFKELGSSLEKLLGKEPDLASRHFSDKAEIRSFMKKAFRKIDIETEVYHKSYPSLVELLKTIKYTGVRGNGTAKLAFWTPGRIKSLEEIYKKDFGEITATYEVIFARGVK